MQPEATSAATTGPSLSTRSVQALAATQAWARLAGFSLLILACVELALVIANLFHQPTLPGNLPLEPGDVLKITVLNSILEAVAAIIYVATGWYALRYARRLEQVRQPGPRPEAVTAALGAQHRYWRLQGTATIVFIALSIIFVIAMAVISIGLATKH